MTEAEIHLRNPAKLFRRVAPALCCDCIVQALSEYSEEWRCFGHVWVAVSAETSDTIRTASFANRP